MRRQGRRSAPLSLSAPRSIVGVAHGHVPIVLLRSLPDVRRPPPVPRVAVVHLAVHFTPERTAAFLSAARKSSAPDAVIVLCRGERSRQRGLFPTTPPPPPALPPFPESPEPLGLPSPRRAALAHRRNPLCLPPPSRRFFPQLRRASLPPFRLSLPVRREPFPVRRASRFRLFIFLTSHSAPCRPGGRATFEIRVRIPAPQQTEAHGKVPRF